MNNRIAVLISGAGTTLKALIDSQTFYGYEVGLVIASRAKVPGLDFAREAGIPWLVPPQEDVFRAIDDYNIGLVCLAGYLKKLEVPEAWHGRVLNIHPSLLPLHGGQGMYGSKVHEAVYASGAKITGCTVHYVDAEYDTGPIISQHPIFLNGSESPQQIEDKVRAAERAHYPEVVRAHQLGRYHLHDGRVVVRMVGE